MWCTMFKKIRNISLVLFLISIFILVFIPFVFLVIFKIFPHLDASENGIGAMPLLAIFLGAFLLSVTGPFMFIMLMIDIARNLKDKNSL